MTGYHVTTSRKLERYKQTGGILPPVRFWPNIETSIKWKKRTGRDVILEIDVSGTSYPLPDHKPARWTNEFVRATNMEGVMGDDERLEWSGPGLYIGLGKNRIGYVNTQMEFDLLVTMQKIRDEAVKINSKEIFLITDQWV